MDCNWGVMFLIHPLVSTWKIKEVKLSTFVKSTVKTLSQTALAVTLLMGNITAPTEESFYEDDAGFNQVSVSMESGWGWGFNQAQAGNDRTGCWDTTEWEPMSCRGGTQDSSSAEDSNSSATFANSDVIATGMNILVQNPQIPQNNSGTNEYVTMLDVNSEETENQLFPGNSQLYSEYQTVTFYQGRKIT